MKPVATRTILPAWAKPFIGIPYKLYGRHFDGVDCWGEVYLVAKHHFGIELPFYGPASADAREMAEIDFLVRGEIGAPLWTRVEGDAIAGDVALFRNEQSQLVHVGIVVDPCWMLHCREGSNSCAIRSTPTLNRLIEGFYRFNPEDLVA